MSRRCLSSLQVQVTVDTLQTMSHFKNILRALNEIFHVNYFFLPLQHEADLLKEAFNMNLLYFGIEILVHINISADEFLHE